MPLQYRKTLTVSAASTTAVAALQAPAAAGTLTLANGTLPNGGQRPTLTATTDLSARTFTFVGTDRIGNAVTTTLAGPNNNTVTLPMTLATITSIAYTGGTMGAATISAGYAAQADLAPLPLDLSSDATNVSLTCVIVSGASTPAYTVRFTQSNVQDATLSPASYVWFNHSSLVAQTASATGNFAAPVVAVSVFLDGGGAASVDFVVIQSVKSS